MRRTALSGLALTALTVSGAFGYIRQYVDTARTIPYYRPDHAAIQYLINNQIAAGQVSNATGANVTVVSAASDPVGAVRAALARWNQVGASINFLPLQSTANIHNQSDFTHVIVFAAGLQDLSVLGYSANSTGAIAVTAVAVAPQTGTYSNGMTYNAGDILDADILLNSSLTFSTDLSTPYDIQTVLTHELGHALGLNHTGLLGATMFQYGAVGKNAVLSERLLSTDETTFANVIYPSSSAPATGTISGKVVASDGSAVKFALLTMVDQTLGNSFGSITAADGTYFLQVPPASYVIYAEPMTGTSIVETANIYGVDPSQVISTFQPTILGGAANPTAVAVTAGNTATAPTLTVAASGTNTLTYPFFAFGSAGGAGDVTTLNGIGGPSVLASGQSVDLAFLGGGLNGTESVLVLGQGVSVTTPIHVDRNANFATTQTPYLATIFISRAGSALALSGFLVIVPPTPTFTSAGVVSAASYIGLNGVGAVSPGGLYTIYDLPNTPNLGPSTFAVPNGYDVYGHVPTTLAGVSVTFDGIPGPIFLAFNGQLNVQVPFELAGKTSTVVQVNYLGSLSKQVAVNVLASQPAFFTVTPLGNDSIVTNQDNSLNTVKNPAPRGTVVTIYGTGLGKLSYAVQTGVGAPAPPAGFTGGQSCVLGGTTFINVPFAGWTPTAVGLAQWSFVIPTAAGTPTGTVTVRCTDTNGTSTQQGTIYIN